MCKQQSVISLQGSKLHVFVHESQSTGISAAGGSWVDAQQWIVKSTECCVLAWSFSRDHLRTRVHGLYIVRSWATSN